MGGNSSSRLYTVKSASSIGVIRGTGSTRRASPYPGRPTSVKSIDGTFVSTGLGDDDAVEYTRGHEGDSGFSTAGWGGATPVVERVEPATVLGGQKGGLPTVMGEQMATTVEREVPKALHRAGTAAIAGEYAYMQSWYEVLTPMSDKDTRIQRNMVNFSSFDAVEKNHKWMSSMLPAWSIALKVVDRNPDRVTGGVHGLKALQTMNRYAYPSPNVFTGGEHGEWLLLAWIRFRPTWVGAMNVGTHVLTKESAPKNDAWKRGLCDLMVQYGLKKHIPDKEGPKGPASVIVTASTVLLPPIRMGFSTLPGGKGLPTKPRSAPNANNTQERIAPKKSKQRPAHARRTAQRTEAAQNAFGDLVRNAKPVDNDPILYGVVIAFEKGKMNLEESGIGQLAMWEVCELNFRAEVVVLDRMLRPDLWADGKARSRNAKISSLFYMGELTPSLPFLGVMSGHLGHIRYGGGNNDPDRNRVRMLWKDIVCSWPCPIGHKEPSNDMTPEEFDTALNAYYMQCFFDFFGRCSSIPRTLPSNPSE